MVEQSATEGPSRENKELCRVGKVRHGGFHLMGTLSTIVQHTYAHQQQCYISIPSQHQANVQVHVHVPTCVHVHACTCTCKYIIIIAKPTDQAYSIDMGRVEKQFGWVM